MTETYSSRFRANLQVKLRVLYNKMLCKVVIWGIEITDWLEMYVGVL